jgi:urease accessory protein
VPDSVSETSAPIAAAISPPVRSALPLFSSNTRLPQKESSRLKAVHREPRDRNPNHENRTMLKRLAAAAVILGLSAAPAFAHLDPAEHGSFMAGVSHPLFGLDHILAMVSVGLWAALLGGRAIWLVPSAFVGTMLLGFALALAGLGLPFVEPAIAASAVVIGLLALVALQVPTAVGMVMVGFFSLFHGYAHGGELGEAGALNFCVGFALSTMLLHAVGVGAGLAMGRVVGGSSGRWMTRIAGGLTALGGLWLVAGN